MGVSDHADVQQFSWQRYAGEVEGQKPYETGSDANGGVLKPRHMVRSRGTAIGGHHLPAVLT